MTDAFSLNHLLTLARMLGADELAVLTMVAERLVQGQKRYGVLDAANDRRCFRVEALEEAADGLVYVAVALMRKEGG